MGRASLLSAIVLASSLAAAAQERPWLGPISVKTDYGEIIFTDVFLFGQADSLSPWFDAMVINRTGTGWHYLKFNVSYNCGGTRFGYSISVSEITPARTPGKVSVPPNGYQALPFCENPSLLAILYQSSEWNDRQKQDEERAASDELRAQEQAKEAERARKGTAQRAAARKEADRQAKETAIIRAAKQRESERLARLPSLMNGAEAVFVGSDRKCAQQFVEAASMEGLEKRKRIAELVSFGCGFLTKSRTRVSVAQSSGDYALVSIEEGEQNGKQGWVANAWLLRPAAIK